MPGPYLLLFEIFAYLQLALCLAHALRHGTPGRVRLSFAAVLGLFLELVTLRQNAVFAYGRFLLVPGGVPLCVAFAWGSIIYSAMEFSDATSLPRWQRPLLDGLLALNVAVALDPAAMRMGLWDWGRDPASQFFGVPYSYYLAWFAAVLTFSTVFRLPSHPKNGAGLWLPGPLAALTGLIVLIVISAFITFAIPYYYHALLAILILACTVIYLISLQPRLYQKTVTPLVLLIPLINLLYVAILGSISGALFDPPVLVIVPLAMLAVLFALHWPWIRHAFGRKPDFAG
jgi:hypothetical protein